MDCPSCGARTRTLETRRAADGSVRRRRNCPECGERFTTHERREPGPLRVRKRDGSVEPFDPAKLRSGLIRAAHKRPVTTEAVERIVRRVERAIAEAGGRLDASRIGEICLDGLREVDGGAYLQYAGTLGALQPPPPGSGAPSDGESPRNHRASAGSSSVRVGEDAAWPTPESK